jgi:hypothetical protein
MRFRIAAFALGSALLLTACTDSAQRDPAHPDDLTGRWIRLRPDNSSGATMTFSRDGTLLGSQSYPVPPNLHWEVKADPKGKPQYCAEEGSNGFCRYFRLAGDTLELFGGPQGNTTFRRVR